MRQANFILIAIVGVLALSLSSCSTSQTFTVQGTPGTLITSPQNQQLGFIDNSGQINIKMKRKEGYMHYLQAKAPGSSLSVPFALDYKNNGKRCVRRGAGQTIMVIGAIVELSGALALALGGDAATTSGAIMVGGGAAFAGLGFAMGAANTPIDYDYDYQKLQTTNNDVVK